MPRQDTGTRLPRDKHTWRGLIEAARDYQAKKSSTGGSPPTLPDTDQTTVLIKATASRGRLDVVGVGSAWRKPTDDLDQFKNQHVFEEAAVSECQQFAILLEPANEAGEIVPAVILGGCVAYVNVKNIDHHFATPKTGINDKLHSTAWGPARIIWKDPAAAPGDQWVVVEVGRRPQFGIFELADNTVWQTDPAGEAYAPGCRAVLYLDAGSTYDPDPSETHNLFHHAGYPGQEATAIKGAHLTEITAGEDGRWPARFTDGDRVWATWNHQDCRWQILAPYEDIWRFVLTSSLAKCGTASADLILFDGTYCTPSISFLLTDSMGLIPGDPVTASFASDGSATSGSGGLEAGVYGFAKFFADSKKWELINYGEGCCGSLSSESPSSPSSEGSDVSSDQPPSESDSESPSPSSEPSTPSSQPSTSSESEPSESEPSTPSDEPPSDEPPSSKSTAIVPASWTPTGYTALFIAEMPEIRFDDVYTIDLETHDQRWPIDPKYIEVCEPGTIQACGATITEPLAMAVTVEDAQIRIRTQPIAGGPPPAGTQVVVRLTGIRAGFKGERFPDRTARQFAENEAFINSAYSADG